ncbi:glycosyltransferase family 2 protein [Paenibacillus sp. PsM32]|uniref:glycosyltransferase family 2 protein n=1 Tax=Paenibacillus sp. PsM32 TaxID=3030536 RepID=UPI00263B6123|nr:glycosyltransferase family 2 protein [Paenibacillus sp. PsM32]MDN4620953.1 glycosyltransferase family 2 protein [Paenibacillus sp. PsM32]
MNSENIKVSVIVPMYNVEDYIQETLESLINQNLAQFEIILIDDQSIDSTYDIASHFANQYNFIVLHQLEKNCGVSVARNKAIEMARGEFIFFLDSDDTIPLNTLELMYDTAIQKNADLVTGIYERFDSKSQTMMNFFYQFPELQQEGYKSIYDCPSLLYSVYACGKLIKKSIINDIRFSEKLKYGEDQVFTIACYLRSNKIYHLATNVYNYRIREIISNSASQSVYKDPLMNFNYLIEMLRNVQDEFKLRINDTDLRSNMYSIYFKRVLYWNIWTAISNTLLSLNVINRKIVIEKYIFLINNLDEQIFKNNKNDFEVINLKIEKLKSVLDTKTIESIKTLSQTLKNK